MEYPYPIDVEWSQEEIIQVIEFLMQSNLITNPPLNETSS